MNQYECASQLEGAGSLKAPYERINHQLIKKVKFKSRPGDPPVCTGPRYLSEQVFKGGFPFIRISFSSLTFLTSSTLFVMVTLTVTCVILQTVKCLIEHSQHQRTVAAS